MGLYDEVDARLRHHNDVADGLTDCKCEVHDVFEYEGRVYSAVKFSDECVNPEIGIKALTE